MKVINPATGTVITEINEDTILSLRSKYNLLRANQNIWSAIDIQDRVSIILKFVHLLKNNVEELAQILTSEMGKPLQQSRNEIIGAAAKAEWLANHAEQYLKCETVHESATKEIIKYEPLGVVANISAWNYPYNVGVNVFIPALLAGNAVFYKPSEFASLTGMAIEKYLKLSGVPSEVFQVAFGDGKVGDILLDFDFDLIGFTGSYKTGKLIYEKVANKMTPCIMELGGKDPIYVVNDIIDIRTTAIGIADGAFYNNGQSCCSVERIYVHEDIYDEFCEYFLEEVRSWKIGLPTEEGVYISVLSRKEHVEFLQNQVEDAIAKGAKLLHGGHKISGSGYGFEPTILINVNHQMSVMKDESFGPIIGIMKVQSDEEAIELMNDTEYGLTAGVYASSQERAERILAELNTGSVYWNCCDRVSAALPWSGRKNSGFGSTLSHSGLRAFTKMKAYHLRSL